jgi:hypothetical protein
VLTGLEPVLLGVQTALYEGSVLAMYHETGQHGRERPACRIAHGAIAQHGVKQSSPNTSR